ncbi:MAG: YbhB/YbcL family Raf kinase inhibitor-like protein [Bacteroidia bacterium]
MAIVSNTTLKVKSPAFEHNGHIPEKYTCEGQNINPAISVTDIPKGTESLALIMDDPDAPKGTFDHWIMWNISPQGEINENGAPGVQGKNGRGENKYTGPCPPSGNHHYHFKIYALDTKLDIPALTNKNGLLKAMTGHIIASGELIGVYKKTKS